MIIKRRCFFVLFAIFLTLIIFISSICIGSINYSVKDVIITFISCGKYENLEGAYNIILNIRLPRVLCAALVGAALSLGGVCMQGMLKNPLADGSTLGVSSGAALGGAISIFLSTKFDFISELGVGGLSILFAFLSMLLILAISGLVDSSYSGNTIILVGIIFSMFSSSIISLIISFAGEKIKNIMFWSMGSFGYTNYNNVIFLFAVILIASILLVYLSDELNALSVGEDNAVSVGVNVYKVKILIIITVSVLIGASVSISGNIAFVGLVIPHISRFIIGADYVKLIPFTIWLALYLCL